MRGVSAESQAGLLEKVEQVARDGADLSRLGDELFAVVATLDGSAQLRRALTDPAASADQKADIARHLFESRLDARSLEVVIDAVGRRWSQPRDLGDALERAGAEAHVGDAERQGKLDDTEDELFRFGRLVERDPQLRQALTD